MTTRPGRGEKGQNMDYGKIKDIFVSFHTKTFVINRLVLLSCKQVKQIIGISVIEFAIYI